MRKKLFWLFTALGLGSAAAGGAIWALWQNFGAAALLALLPAAALLLLAASGLAAEVVRPLSHITEDLEELTSRAPYPELLPMLEALHRQQAQKEENVRQRQEFSANVSHELKTPLTSISGYAEMIETGMAKDEDITEFAGKIHAEAKRLLDLIHDIIKLSELDEPQAGEDLAPIELLPIVQDTCGLLGFSAERAQIKLSVAGSYGKVNGRRELLEELIYNLCDNAIRYNKPGGYVQVTVTADSENVSLSVADNGIGIPPEHQERIFERFYRADKSRSKASGGTGLGLAIVKHIVIQLNAHLELDSTPDKGTTITVQFPQVA